MDYKKKYEKALERARKLHSEPTGETKRIVCEQIFPELMESEYERIRRRIYNYINVTLDDNESAEKERWLAWLEKQR